MGQVPEGDPPPTGGREALWQMGGSVVKGKTGRQMDEQAARELDELERRVLWPYVLRGEAPSRTG